MKQLPLFAKTPDRSDRVTDAEWIAYFWCETDRIVAGWKRKRGRPRPRAVRSQKADPETTRSFA
jgi:hypothetical protein